MLVKGRKLKYPKAGICTAHFSNTEEASVVRMEAVKITRVKFGEVIRDKIG